MRRTDELREKGEIRHHASGSARELLSATLGSDPWQRIEELREIGQRKAEAEGLAYQMEHERKHVLSKIASEYASTHAKEQLSEAKLDRMAHADSRYLDFIKGSAVAIEKREMANSEYWAVRSELEWDRAAVAHSNAMSRLEEPA